MSTGSDGDANLLGGGVGFMALTPCADATDYQSGDAITFPNGDNSYAPKHITTTQGAVATRAFTFAVSGFFAYYCTNHGLPDSGSGMSGVIWAQ